MFRMLETHYQLVDMYVIRPLNVTCPVSLYKLAKLFNLIELQPCNACH